MYILYEYTLLHFHLVLGLLNTSDSSLAKGVSSLDPQLLLATPIDLQPIAHTN